MLVEAFTYRMGAHTTSDDPTRYRVAAELEAWKLKDPIERVRVYLARNGLADHDFFESVEVEAEALAVELRAGCRALPDPDSTRCSSTCTPSRTRSSTEERAQIGGVPLLVRTSTTPLMGGGR